MTERQGPNQNQPFEIGDLVRLNEELRQLREVLKRKRAEREAAKRQGKRLLVDLTPEIERLNRFLTDLNRVSAKLKATTLNPPTARLGEYNALGQALGKVRTEIESEKSKLEAERAARQEEHLRLQEELQHLRDEFQRSKELLGDTQKSVRAALTKTIEQTESPQPELREDTSPKPTPSSLQLAFTTGSIIPERPQVTTSIEPTISQEENSTAEVKAPASEPPTRLQPTPPEEGRMPEERKRENDKVADEFAVIRSELQNLREEIARQQNTLDGRRRDLDLEKRKVEEERRVLESRIADTFAATRSELERMRDQISRKQEELDRKQRQLYDERIILDEERRMLKERAAEADGERVRFTARKIMEELRDERSELARLKRSLQQLRLESVRERRRLERERDSILKTRVSLANQKRRTELKNTLLRIRAQQTLMRQRTAKKMEKTGKQARESKEERGDLAKPPPPSNATVDEGVLVLGVRLGTENYGIDIGQVSEIVRRQAITPLPHQPTYVEGVMNIRGTIIPVVNLRRRFDLGGAPAEEPRVVIVNSSEGTAGILVDSVSEVIRLPRDQIHPPPAISSGLDGQYVRGICRVDDRLLLHLDVEKILRRATPLSTLQTSRAIRADKSQLEPDEQKLLKQIPPTGITKSRLKRRARFGDRKLRRTISSLARKGLVKTLKDGNRKLISRVSRGPLPTSKHKKLSFQHNDHS